MVTRSILGNFLSQTIPVVTKPYIVQPRGPPGLAIATNDGGIFYRLACDKDWNTIQDHDYVSLEEAVNELPKQYQHAPVL